MSKEHTLPKIIFVDFNGVISYKPFWFSLKMKYPKIFEQINTVLFKQNKDLIKNWMVGKFTSEDIIDFLAKHIDVDKNLLWSVFVDDCKNIDISEKVLNLLQTLKNKYRLILRTDNMDCFTRFTLPHNKLLQETFDTIDNSFELKSLKKDNDGKYFIEKAKLFGSNMSDCILIDDSQSNCDFFQSIGGLAYCLSGEDVIERALKSYFK